VPPVPDPNQPNQVVQNDDLTTTIYRPTLQVHAAAEAHLQRAIANCGVACGEYTGAAADFTRFNTVSGDTPAVNQGELNATIDYTTTLRATIGSNGTVMCQNAGGSHPGLMTQMSITDDPLTVVWTENMHAAWPATGQNIFTAGIGNVLPGTITITPTGRSQNFRGAFPIGNPVDDAYLAIQNHAIATTQPLIKSLVCWTPDVQQNGGKLPGFWRSYRYTWRGDNSVTHDSSFAGVRFGYIDASVVRIAAISSPNGLCNLYGAFTSNPQWSTFYPNNIPQYTGSFSTDTLTQQENVVVIGPSGFATAIFSAPPGTQTVNTLMCKAPPPPPVRAPGNVVNPVAAPPPRVAP
jgi:hypothetical protein